MESGGISIISAKSLQTDINVFNNQAFILDDLGKKNSSGNVAISNDVIANGDKVPGEVMSAKVDSSTTDFSLPSKRVSKDKLQPLPDKPYRGMGKEELLRFSSRPLWRNLRYVCISTVLTGWLALLITVVALVLTYPACREAQDRSWWQKAVIYRIYVRSFYDSDSNGIGDINGIRQKLDYLKNLGVDTIALSPIYKMAPNASTDTHIVNHTDIDHDYGTLEDFKRLVNETHQLGMYITLDFIPNHTSDMHPWFLASKENSNSKENEFRSYYVWMNGRGSNMLQKPNNWKTVDECSSAWTLNSDNYFYLHQFMKSLPDLNLRSWKVRDALEDILQFWLDLGVDGFYIRDADFLFEDYDLRDHEENRTNVNCSTQKVGYVPYDYKFTKGLSEVFDMIARWRSFLDDYGNKTGQYRILFADVDGSYDHVMDYYGLYNRDGVDFPLNKFSLQFNITARGGDISRMVSSWIDVMPKNHWPNWMGGDDRNERLVDRLGDLAGPYLILLMLLPGTPYVYYGDEIGLSSTSDSINTRDWSLALPVRGPMQWSNGTSAGFCAQYCNNVWMDFNPEFKKQMNVEAQMKNPESLWNLFRNLTILRKNKPSFEYGDYIATIQDEDIFSFIREYDGEKGYLVALNFADKTVHKDYIGVHGTIPDSAKVEIVAGKSALHFTGGSASLHNLALAAFEGIVVSWDYQAKDL